MKRSILALSLAVCFAPLSNAATVIWSAIQDNGFSLADGSNLTAGNLVRVGSFNISDSVIAANAGNIAFLNSHFVEFGNARIGDGQAAGAPEHFDARSEADVGAILGNQIYLWVFASTDKSSVAGSIATAFQNGIFYLSELTNGEWAFPDDESLVTIDLSDLTDASGNALVNGAAVVVGDFPKGTSDLSTKANFGLAVPEPSTATAVIASVGLLALRRRRRA